MLKKFSNIVWFICIAIFCWLMIDLTLPYLGFSTDVDFLLTKQKIIHLKHWRYSFYIHIFFSIFALAAGLTQFSSHLLMKRKKLHRAMGYVYVIDILFLAGPTGLIMGFYANGTAWAKISFMVLASLWIVFTALALKKAISKDFSSHRNWMMRSYALTLSAITLRLFAMFLPRWFHMEAFAEYTLIAWLSWMVNLVIAEGIILLKKRSAPVFG
jgi:hypothetical protein